MKKEFCRKLVDFYKSERTEDKMTVKNATLKDKSGNTIHPITKGVLVINNDSENLGDVEAGAQVNTIEGVQVASSDLTPDSSTKKVNIPVASANTYGVIKAEAKTSSDTQEVKIDTTTGKLYTAPGGGGSSVSVDNETIRENASDELEVIGIIEQNDGVATKVWTGTYAEYVAITNKDQDTIYNITDDALPGETIVPGNGLSYDSSTMTLDVVNADSSTKGIAKLYNTVGTNTDGAMTQGAVKSNYVAKDDVNAVDTIYNVSTVSEFTTLISNLKNNIYNGRVYIKFAAGTYNLSGQILLDAGTVGNISQLILMADTANTVTINFSNAPNYNGAFKVYQTPTQVQFVNLTINCSDTKNAQVGIQSDYGNVLVQNCTLVDWVEGITAARLGMVLLVGTITCTNCTSSILVYGGTVGSANAKLTFTNSTYGINIQAGGRCSLINAQRIFSNVTNISNMTIGSSTADGYFGGVWYT